MAERRACPKAEKTGQCVRAGQTVRGGRARSCPPPTNPTAASIFLLPSCLLHLRSPCCPGWERPSPKHVPKYLSYVGSTILLLTNSSTTCVEFCELLCPFPPSPSCTRINGHFYVSPHNAFPPASQWEEIQLQRGF